jgi:nucleotide-binding universal stress UspA family protein
MKLLEKILVLIELNKTSVDQLRVPIQLANKFNSQLILLHVLPAEANKESINSLIMKYVNEDFKRILTDLKKIGIQAEKRIAFGNKTDQTLSISEKENVSLILIVNEIEHIDNNYNINTVAEKLIRKSQKPIWVVKSSSEMFPDKILCPVDFSDSSERALNNAIRISRTFQAELFIITVFEPLEENTSLRYNIDFKEENEELENETRKKFKEFLKKFNFTDINYNTELIRGKIYEQIVTFAKVKDINLIFMGANGKSLLQRVFLGSVTEMVIRQFPCSMVITKSENILNLKIDFEISEIEKHFTNAMQLEKIGYYEDAIDQLKICLQINDLHIPALNALIKLYIKVGKNDLSEMYSKKLEEILRRLWDKKIEMEIRKNYKL